ncbi:HD-GYP domain-containing protein [Fundidesulfovibrio butyratiphilus]
MLKKLRVYDLQVGMYVVDTGLSWIDHPLLYSQEGYVTSEEEIVAIREEGYAELFIETDKDKQCAGSVRLFDRGEVERALDDAQAELDAETATNKSVPLLQELEHARVAHRKAMEVAKRVLDAVAVGRPFDAQACQDLAREVSASVSRNRDALVCLAWLHDTDPYLLRHSASVSVLAAAFGDFLGLNRVQVGELALAGFLHDVGKALSPQDVLAKPGRLTPEQFHRLKFHPIESCTVISARMSLPQHVIRGISEHHERVDGSGYPRGISGKELSFFGQILGVADVYDAMTQDRPHQKAVTPGKALGTMYARRDKDFSAGILERFIKCLGVYTVGSLVRLNSGECAVVCESNPDTPLRPKVAIVFDERMRPMHPVSVDLAGSGRLAKRLEIREVLDHKALGVNPSHHFG